MTDTKDKEQESQPKNLIHSGGKKPESEQKL